MIHIVPPVGRILIPPVSGFASALPSSDTLYAVPFWKLGRNVFVDAIGTKGTTAGVGPNLNIRLGLYRSRGGMPGELLVDSGVLSLPVMNTVAQATFPEIPYSMGDTPVWGVLVHQGGNTTNASVAGASVAGIGDVVAMLGAASINDLPRNASTTPTCLTAGFTFGALPADAGDLPWSVAMNTIVPLVGLRRSR